MKLEIAVLAALDLDSQVHDMAGVAQDRCSRSRQMLVGALQVLPERDGGLNGLDVQLCS
jgi:hypothetical protein